MQEQKRGEGGGGTGYQLGAEDCGEDLDGIVPYGPPWLLCEVRCAGTCPAWSGLQEVNLEMQTFTSQSMQGSVETTFMQSGAQEGREALRT